MRRLRDYSLRDWGRLRPLTQASKTVRWDAMDQIYRRRRSTMDRTLEAIHAQGNRPLAITVAFNTPWVVALQIDRMRQALPSVQLVIADNSTDPDAAATIAALSADAGLPYVRLPRTPSRHPSRSHGLALNWLHRNLVRVVWPPAFAFLDHDLIPLAPVDPFAALAAQPVYGRLEDRAGGWYLWAGYCAFGREAMAAALDFRQDWFYGLDTGGRLYRTYLRCLDRRKLRFARLEGRRVRPAAGEPPLRLEMIDGWVHVGGASGYHRDRSETQPVISRLVEDLSHGAVLDDVLEPSVAAAREAAVAN